MDNPVAGLSTFFSICFLNNYLRNSLSILYKTAGIILMIDPFEN